MKNKTSGFSVIDNDMDVEGSLSCNGQLVIRGSVKGSIKAEGVVISDNGVVLADTKVNNMVVGGKFEGDIVATDEVTILSTGICSGKVECKNLVIEAQKLGITLDVSHMNDLAFWDFLKVTNKPFMATHSNTRVIGNHLRDLTDDQLKAIQEKRGTIGLNFGGLFLNSTITKENVNSLTLEDYKKHIDHIVEVTDINTVAIGSDYDGTTISYCMKDVSYLPKLWEYLLDNGFSKEDLNKISHKNLLRVFKDTWRE